MEGPESSLRAGGGVAGTGGQGLLSRLQLSGSRGPHFSLGTVLHRCSPQPPATVLPSSLRISKPLLSSPTNQSCRVPPPEVPCRYTSGRI